MILGLTGGIGCGKSTAGLCFEAFGFKRIDCDALVKNEVLVDPAVLSAVRERFGSEVFEGGLLLRSKLAEKVFACRADLDWLEALVHPRVHALWTESVRQAPEHPWVVEVPLLFEKKLNKVFDFVVCVACAPSIQLARLERRGLPRLLALQRISQQLPLERKIEHSDFVLSNDGSPDFLRCQVNDLASRLL